MKRALIVSALMMSAAGLAAQTGTPRATSLEGQWVVTAAAGQELPPGVHSGLIVTGNKYQGVQNGAVNESGTIAVDATRKPATLDFTIAEGTDAGKKQLCLFELAGDTATVAIGEPGTNVRPASLGGAQTLTLTKIKPLAKDLEGTWEGGVSVNGATQRIAIALTNGANGLATGTLTSIDQGNSELPVTAVLQRGARVTLIVSRARAGFDGQFKDGQLIGTWSQAGAALPLVLKRR